VKVPQGTIDSESLELVASIMGPIRTSPVSNLDRDIIIDRLRIELVDKYYFNYYSLQSERTALKNSNENKSRELCKYLKVGVNECTRALEASCQLSEDGGKTFVPILVILARDLRPPTILAHFPYLCKRLDIPIILLPGKASSDLGKVFRRKSASVIVFFGYKRRCIDSDDVEISRRVSSYVDFATSKIPIKN